jgi:hypothetical protein
LPFFIVRGPPLRCSPLYPIVRIESQNNALRDETHDAMMDVYTDRFGQQVECVSTEALLESWRVSS